MHGTIIGIIYSAPSQVKCKVCMIKGSVDNCPKCAGTNRKPIPMAEVMSGYRGHLDFSGLT